VIERFPERRDEGQNVDIRGAAKDVVRRMGIDQAVRQANTGEVGTRFVTAEGRPAASFPVSAPGGADGPTAELEILRGELSRILIERTQEQTEYRFTSQIAGVTDHGDHVTTVLDDGSVLDSDVVIVAEGLRSRSRRFVSAAEVNDLGMYFAYATIPRRDDDDLWWNWQHVTRRRGVHLRPDNVGSTRAMLTFISDVRGLEDLEPADQIAILRKTFADVGGAAPRILRELEAGAPMYFSVAGQVHVSSWSKGRIGLLGDSAFCNATFGGAGTSLALVGGYILAGELAATSDHAAALVSYQRKMKPFVGAAPVVRPGVLRIANPRNRIGISTVRAAARAATSPAGKALAAVISRATNTAGQRVTLPEYPEP